MIRKRWVQIAALLLCVMMAAAAFAGCTAPPATETASSEGRASEPPVSFEVVQPGEQDASPKYIFLFIGDGMSFAQVHAAQIFTGNSAAGEISQNPLCFTQFPAAGIATTYDATSFIPDSAAAGTAISCGVKTQSGTIGLEADLTTAPQNIAERLKADGKKIGIVTSVTLNHATPAAFYAHVKSRSQYYDIAVQMAESGVDYFGGGSLSEPRGSKNDQPSAFDLLRQNGYAIADTAEAIEALDGNSGKAYAVSPALEDGGSMPFAIDAQQGDPALADFVRKGIDVLDNENGFFMMCEGGQIDWACHANDAATAVAEVLAFSEAVQTAVDFAEAHPGETLIVVTADHETGGMTLGNAANGYSARFDMLGAQRMSYRAAGAAFAEMRKTNPDLALEDVLPVIVDSFGLIAPGAAAEGGEAYVLSDTEYAQLEAAFEESMKSKAQRADTSEAQLLYGGYDPLTVTLTYILNNKAGVGWTSYMHTGVPVPIYAFGAGAELFTGSYDNTDIFDKLAEICGL